MYLSLLYKILPLLRVMYSATEAQAIYTVDHVLLVSVILLIFTQDKAFVLHSQHHVS